MEDGRAARPTFGSPFWACLAFGDWLHGRGVKTSGIALTRQYELLWDYFTSAAALAPAETAAVLARDYARGGRTDAPDFLRAHLPKETAGRPDRKALLPKRQARHAAPMA